MILKRFYVHYHLNLIMNFGSLAWLSPPLYKERNLGLEKLNVLSNITQLICGKLKTQDEFFWL